MDWTQPIDAYCERLDPSFWSEPWNAMTNLAFLLVAILMWRRSVGDAAARGLCVILFAIGIGSFLFHTVATAWASLADVVPIAGFILTYLYLANRDIVGLAVWQAGLATVLFLPYAFVVVFVANQLPFFGISNFYWSVPLLLVIYSVFLKDKHPKTARGMIIGAVILVLSITLRSLDELLCVHVPVGTHLWWHILNAVMLGWMIEVYRRHKAHG